LGEAVRGGHGGQCAIHGFELGAQAQVAPGVEGAHPVFGQRAACFQLDADAFVAHGFADEEAFTLGLGQRPTGFIEHLAQHAIGDGFAVHQHAITIKQNGIK
jgi:hypothetical protein